MCRNIIKKSHHKNQETDLKNYDGGDIMAVEIGNYVGNRAMNGFAMQMGNTGIDSLSKNIQS